MSENFKEDKKLANADNWKHLARWNGEGFYELRTEDTRDVPVRMFLTPRLLADAEDILYRQIVNATRFPGVKLVVIHSGRSLRLRRSGRLCDPDGSRRRRDRHGARRL